MAADKKKKVTSTDIKLALRDMHLSRSSYFITECKTCSTYFPDPQGLLKFEENLYRLQMQHPEIYEEFVTVSEQRRFYVKKASQKAA